MDDDLPKEGELLDISKKRSRSNDQVTQTIPADTTPTKIPFGLLGVLFIIGALAFFSRGIFSAKENPEQVAIYAQGVQSVLSSMKAEFPYLTSVQCEGKDPTKADCINFVGTFRPVPSHPNYLSSMGTIDNVPGVTDAEIELIKGHVKVLADSKRTTLTSRKPFTFLIDSVTIPKVGEEFAVKIKCAESGVDNVVCESIR